MKLVEDFEEAVRAHANTMWAPSVPEHQAIEQAYQHAKEKLVEALKRKGHEE